MTDTPPAKIEPWIRRLALDTVDYIIRHLSVDRYDLTDHVALRLHFSIAAHAPKQEPLSKSVHKRLIAQGAIDPSVPVSKLKEFERELQSRSRAGKAAMKQKLKRYSLCQDRRGFAEIEPNDDGVLCYIDDADTVAIQQLVEEKEQYKTVYTNLCRDLRAERARYIAILQSWKNFDVWAASTVRVPDGQQAVTDAHEELCMKRDAILSEQEKQP